MKVGGSFLEVLKFVESSTAAFTLVEEKFHGSIEVGGSFHGS